MKNVDPYLVGLLEKAQSTSAYVFGLADWCSFATPLMARRLVAEVAARTSYDIMRRVYHAHPQLAPVWWNEPATPSKKRKRRRKVRLDMSNLPPTPPLLKYAEEEMGMLESLPLPSGSDLLEASFECRLQERLLADKVPLADGLRAASRPDALRLLVGLYAIRAELGWMAQAEVPYEKFWLFHSIAVSLACLMEDGLIPLYRQYPELMPREFARVMALAVQRPRTEEATV